ncbi:MAG: malonyl-CoA decarboxylase [Silicimonas sp.]|nr:malonyl-CoA decarboxylase [Silicimonas sp.]
MIATNPLSELLSTLLDRRNFGRKDTDTRRIRDDCVKLLAERAEISGLQLAAKIFGKYAILTDDEKLAFFEFLNEELDVDPTLVASLAETYRNARTPENYAALSRAAEPARQRLFRRLNEAPGATAEIVRMREDLLACVKTHPHLARTDLDLQHLLRSWFNRGFLVMQQVTWDSPATILEKIITYEAVHEIKNWDDLRRRLHPKDRRCFAFFHPSMPTEPLIFVEVALTKGVPNSIQTLLDDNGKALLETEANTAVFYSISNCQSGLAGVSFGSSLIKQVARDLSRDLPNLKTFVTLSPIPGLMRWLSAENISADELDGANLRALAAKYLLTAKDAKGRPVDPVARFHLGNGAQVHALHHGANTSTSGQRQSATVMVNYRYDLGRISQRATQYSKSNTIAASSDTKALAKRA